MSGLEIFFIAFLAGACAFIGGFLAQKYQKNNGSSVINEAQIARAVNESVSKSAMQQSQSLTDNMTKLEERFGKLQLAMVTILNEEMNKVQMLQTDSMQKNKEHFTSQNNQQQQEWLRIREGNVNQLNSLLEKVQKQLTEGLNNLNNQNTRNFDTLNKTNKERLDAIQKEVDTRLKENLRQNLESFDRVKENLGHIRSTAEKMIHSTGSIDKLNNLFERTNSKGYGQFSETYLENLLEEQFNNNHWQKQVSPPGSQDKVDFYIEVAGKKIGIDSKFPVSRYQDVLDAKPEEKQQKIKEFRRTVIAMAKDISNKYIKNRFLDTLLMYLPSDGMYMEIVGDPATSEAIQKTKVTLVGPTTIFPLILLILAYERQININERADVIVAGLEKISRNVTSFREEFRKLGDKINQAQQNYEKADRNLINVGKEINRLEDSQEETKVLQTAEL